MFKAGRKNNKKRKNLRRNNALQPLFYCKLLSLCKKRSNYIKKLNSTNYTKNEISWKGVFSKCEKIQAHIH